MSVPAKDLISNCLQMRKFLTIALAAVAVCACDLSGLLPEPSDEVFIPADEVVINPKRLELKVGETYQMEFTVTPAEAAKQTAKWKIVEGGDIPEGVISLDDNGLVTALKPGYCGISVSIGGKSDLCYVTVAEPVRPTSVTIDPSEVTLYPGQTAQLTAKVLPADAVFTVEWFSEWTQVATIDQNGLVTAVEPGEAWVGALVVGTQMTGKCKVKVLPIEVESVELQVDDNVTLEVGESLQVSATVLPENASDKSLNWSSSDDKVVTVSAEGLVEAVGPGLAEVSATSKNGKSDSFSVSVPEPVVAVENIVFESVDVMMPLGGAPLTELVFEPAASEYAHATEVVWSSTNQSVVAIDEEGRAVAVDYGTSTVTATLGELSATATVTVSQEADGKGVDMGLSVRWAVCNVGAQLAPEYGDVFAWAETEAWHSGKSVSFQAYKWSDKTDQYGNTYTKYTWADQNFIIDLEDDAAHVNWGQKWRMPTEEEYKELIDNCEWIKGTRKHDGNDINGYTAVAPCGARIFFPCVEGWMTGAYTGVFFDNQQGIYWTSYVHQGGGSTKAASFRRVTDTSPNSRTNPYVKTGYFERWSVHAVRAVWDEKL